jgi:hypothetical protein
LLHNLVTSTNNKLFIAAVSTLGLVILNTLPVQVMAQSSPRVNWYELCKNPIVDLAIAEPCHTLTTNGGYTLTPEGERVLACVTGGAAAILAGQPQLLALKNQVGCGSGGSSSGSSNSFSNSFSNNQNEDPITNILDSLFG